MKIKTSHLAPRLVLAFWLHTANRRTMVNTIQWFLASFLALLQKTQGLKMYVTLEDRITSRKDGSSRVVHSTPIGLAYRLRLAVWTDCRDYMYYVFWHRVFKFSCKEIQHGGLTDYFRSCFRCSASSFIIKDTLLNLLNKLLRSYVCVLLWMNWKWLLLLLQWACIILMTSVADI